MLEIVRILTQQQEDQQHAPSYSTLWHTYEVSIEVVLELRIEREIANTRPNTAKIVSKKTRTHRSYLHVVLAGPRQVGRTVPEAGVLLLVTGKVPVPDPDEAIKIEGEHATRGRGREKGLLILPLARRQLENGAAVL